MEENRKASPRLSRWSSLFLSLLMTLILVTFVAQVLSADGPETESDPAAPLGDETDSQAVITGSQNVPSQTVELTPSVEVTSTVAPTPTVELTTTVELTPTVELPPTQAYTVYFPITVTPLPKLSISISRPNSNNQWQVSWQNGGVGATYRLQESQEPDFANLLSDTILPGTMKDFQHDPSTDSKYYYRVLYAFDSMISPWSYAQVVGAYRDDFDDPSTGWAMRRTTFVEGTDVKYGTGNEAGMLLTLVFDRWDWVLGSPMVEAPEVPYVIEYRATTHDASNLISGGISLGGDWNGQACPEVGNYYGTTNCFNHFYNFNYIFHGPISLLFERVDRLFWCPSCGGSQVKRLGDINNTWPAFEVINNANGKNWHNYRVEVRGNGLYLYIDGNYVRSFLDTNYVHEPYFGVFASTDEYKPSIWLYEYYQVTPLD